MGGGGRYGARNGERMIFNTPERVSALTPKNPFDRLADGRPRVPDDLLDRMRAVTSDEAWGVLERRHGYHFQFEGNWLNLHPDLVLVGQAVTAVMVPRRPDLDEVVEAIGREEGRRGGQNTWVIDSLQENDVLVVDLFGKIHDGTFIGDNLATAARARTGTGIVIDGGIRDYQRVERFTDFAVFCRGVDPSAIADVTLIGVNVPIRIGHATVLPGDVVLGTRSGLTFVPPHLAEEVVVASEDVRERDVFGKQRLAEGTYTTGQIDVSVWAEEIEADYHAWRAGRAG
jgi:4-hydroxy-4-methyl-2-oxoglutarate aldolase